MDTGRQTYAQAIEYLISVPCHELHWTDNNHCCCCGTAVDPLGQHALSCKKHPGRIQRHAWLNDLIHRALIRAEIPAVKEPQGLSRDDGKRPDGLTLVPWQSGRSAMWDVTVAHTLATSYVSQNALQAGSAAAAESVRKTTKYSTLSASHMFFSGGSGDSWSFIG